MKKRILSTALAALLLIGCVGVTASADVGGSTDDAYYVVPFTVSNVLSKEKLTYEQLLNRYSNLNVKGALDSLNFNGFWGEYIFKEEHVEEDKIIVYHCNTSATVKLVESVYSIVLKDNFRGITLGDNQDGKGLNSSMDVYVADGTFFDGKEVLRAGSSITAVKPGVYLFYIEYLSVDPDYFILDVTGDSVPETTDVVITDYWDYDNCAEYIYEISNTSKSVDTHRYALLVTDSRIRSEIHFLCDRDIPAGSTISGSFLSYLHAYEYFFSGNKDALVRIITFDDRAEYIALQSKVPYETDDHGNSTGYIDKNGLLYEIKPDAIGDKWLKDTFGITI